MSVIPGLSSIWDKKTPTGGNSRTIDVGILTHQVHGNNKYRSVAGPIFRIITDLNRTIWTLDIGNSGRIFSKHFDDFMGHD